MLLKLVGRSSLLCLLMFALVANARAQFEDDTKAKSVDGGPKIDKTLTQKIKIGVEVKAVGGPVKGIHCTLPVPTDWPEQQVKVLEEKQSSHVRSVTYKNLQGGVKQMIVEIPSINSGDTASAYVILEVARSSLIPPGDTTKLSIPKKIPNGFNWYMQDSPMIETRHGKIVALAKEIPATDNDWAKVEAIYDLIRSKLEYKNGAAKSVVKALADGNGDCEELTGLFIALCRQQKIPARTVWVDGHCYPEFYLVDELGVGHWFPCQAAGSRAFGGIPEHRAVLQKGDSFADPDRPRERLRYVSEFMKGLAVKGGGDPQHKFIREVLPN